MTHQAHTVREYSTDTRPDIEPEAAVVRERYGKADLVASVLGMFAAIGTLVFLTALFAAGAANVEPQINLLNQDGTLSEVETVGAIAAGVVLFVSFLVGGIAAGRMSRYDGGMNGMGTALWFLLLVTVFAALGAWVGEEYNAFALADLPNWAAQVDVEEITTAAIVASAVAVVVTLLGGYLGGRIGDSYNRKVDAALVDEARR
ncbi:MAG: hypothetical protein ACRDWF_06235 [Acidimicrobiia bacterium]